MTEQLSGPNYHEMGPLGLNREVRCDGIAIGGLANGKSRF